jgi:hypothetical protein
MKQIEAVVLALEKLGGIATLGQLNQETMKIKECTWNTKTPYASIRRIVQLHKDIYKIKPGLYGLVAKKKDNEAKGIIIETAKNKNSPEIIEFNHSYYQGILVTMGNLKGFKTFIPNQDKNKKFIDKSLVDIRTLDSIPEYSYAPLVRRSSSIDVIWFNERNMPHSFFEVEHSTNFQNSLLKFSDLQDFYTRMVIIADAKNKKEFQHKMEITSFKNLEENKRVIFCDYEALVKQYENIIAQQSYEVIL